MSIDQRMSDAQYHDVRAEQERRLAAHARTSEARDRHAQLMQLHQLRRDALAMAG